MSIKLQPNQTYKVYFPEKSKDSKYKIPKELLGTSCIKRADVMLTTDLIKGYLNFNLSSGLRFALCDDYEDYGITINLYIGASDDSIQVNGQKFELDSIDPPECTCTGRELALTGHKNNCYYKNYKSSKKENTWIF